jgi:membrane protease subunit HflC
MRTITIPILVAIIFLVMAVYLVTFQVRETESAFVTRFGKPVREITRPGLYCKWPAPIEQVHKFDSRMRVLEAGELSETTTREAVPIIINTYVVWRVAEPLKFYNAVKTVANAQRQLSSQISDTQNRVVGQHAFSEFVNSDPNRVKFDEIQREMLADLKGSALKDYGIEVRTLGMRQLKVSEDVTKKVFDRMKAERQSRTQSIISEGDAAATTIRSTANKQRADLLAAAEGRAKQIRGQGDAEAAKYYEMLKADPALAMLLRKLEALATVLKDRATVVIPIDSEPFDLLRRMPALEPSQPAQPQ